MWGGLHAPLSWVIALLFAFAVCGRLAAAADVGFPARCIVAVNGAGGTFRFHRRRTGERWLAEDIDGYGEMVDVGGPFQGDGSPPAASA